MTGRPAFPDPETQARRQLREMCRFLYGSFEERFRHNSEDLAKWKKLITRTK